jgi:asparagine synthase (glutamine-hydrolysing)
VLSWQDGAVTVGPYWRLDFSPGQPQSVDGAAHRLRELLLDATKVRMLSERPLGAFLSGGIDSSAVVAAMARQSSGAVKTFSVGFEDARFDERAAARLLARHYGTDHQEYVVTPAALDVLPTLVRHFDEPFADASAIPSFYVAQLGSRDVTVALTGDGGDESFGGYQRYAVMHRAGRIPAPRIARPALRQLGSSLADHGPGQALSRRVGRGLEFLGTPASRQYAAIMSCFQAERKQALYTDELREELAGVDSLDLLGDAFAASRAPSRLGQLMDVDVNTYLPGDLLAKVDITTMACSLEARSPFLDHHLMEWAAGLPDSYKVRASTTKFLLKRAMRPWLPPELLARKKQGFAVPLASWLRTDLRELSRDVLTDATAQSRGFFRPQEVARLLSEHQQGRDNGRRIWALIQFELWHRTYLDAPVAVAARVPARPAPL